MKLAPQMNTLLSLKLFPKVTQATHVRGSLASTHWDHSEDASDNMEFTSSPQQWLHLVSIHLPSPNEGRVLALLSLDLVQCTILYAFHGLHILPWIPAPCGRRSLAEACRPLMWSSKCFTYRGSSYADGQETISLGKGPRVIIPHLFLPTCLE